MRHELADHAVSRARFLNEAQLSRVGSSTRTSCRCTPRARSRRAAVLRDAVGPRPLAAPGHPRPPRRTGFPRAPRPATAVHRGVPGGGVRPRPWVVHRDLKPSNVMLGDYGETLVIDWGVAKYIGDGPAGEGDWHGNEEPAPVVSGHPNTAAGQLLGTRPYMSPEQLACAADADAASDVFSLGAILLEILTGATPGIPAKSKAPGPAPPSSPPPERPWPRTVGSGTRRRRNSRTRSSGSWRTSRCWPTASRRPRGWGGGRGGTPRGWRWGWRSSSPGPSRFRSASTCSPSATGATAHWPPNRWRRSCAPIHRRRRPAGSRGGQPVDGGVRRDGRSRRRGEAVRRGQAASLWRRASPGQRRQAQALAALDARLLETLRRGPPPLSPWPLDDGARGGVPDAGRTPIATRQRGRAARGHRRRDGGAAGDAPARWGGHRGDCRVGGRHQGVGG